MMLGTTNIKVLYNGYRVFSGDKERPGSKANPSPLLVPWSRKGRALRACTRVHFTLHLVVFELVTIRLCNKDTRLWGLDPWQRVQIIHTSCCEANRNLQYNNRESCLICRVKWILSELYADLYSSSRVELNIVATCDCNLESSGMQESTVTKLYSDLKQRTNTVPKWMLASELQFSYAAHKHYVSREKWRIELCSLTKGSMRELNYQHKIKPKSAIYSSYNKVETFKIWF